MPLSGPGGDYQSQSRIRAKAPRKLLLSPQFSRVRLGGPAARFPPGLAAGLGEVAGSAQQLQVVQPIPSPPARGHYIVYFGPLPPAELANTAITAEDVCPSDRPTG